MEISKKIASNLLQIKAIKINAQNLFVWASGIHSPVYCDNRLALSYPDIRESIIEGFMELSEKFQNIDYIAGVATAGIPWGAILADRLKLPFVYIRSNAKSHGRQNKIEGELNPDKNVLVIEDLISTGGSSLQAVQAIRENGNTVLSVLAIFNYNLKKSEINFKNADCDFYSISNFDVLIEEAEKQKYISSGEFEIIKEWKTDPENWFKKFKI